LLSRKKDNIWAKYYYDNGNIMAIYYVKESKKNIGQSKSWRKYYDINGKKTSKEDLIRNGYKKILEM
jgi:hypothetical protein